MKLPLNVSRHPDGLFIRVRRGGVVHCAFVPHSHPNPIARAIELRDRFIRLYGEVQKYRFEDARSNTGVTGVSETCHFHGSAARHVFSVSWSDGRRQHKKRFEFRDLNQRSVKLAQAIQFRRQKEACHV